MKQHDLLQYWIWGILLGLLCWSGCEQDWLTQSGSNSAQIPDGAYWLKEDVHRPYPPSNFHAVVGWAQAATLSPNQPGEVARVSVDYMKLIEVSPTTGTRVIAEETYDTTVPTAFWDGGLYLRFPRWFATDDHTPVWNAEVRNGLLIFDVAATPRNIVHWWTDRASSQPNAHYYQEMRVKIEGKVGVQLGVDYWTTLTSQWSGWDANCEGVNNCEAWVSDWYGDTGGEFILIRAPHE